MEFRVQTFNNISAAILAEFFPPNRFVVSATAEDPHAILLRSADLHKANFGPSLRVVGRAGMGFNNVPVDILTERGVAVFNAPGANSNAVKELTIASLIIGSRKLGAGWDFARRLYGNDEQIDQKVEAGKKAFNGIELAGRTLGVIGLGHIGLKVARAAKALEMNVRGHDTSLADEGKSKVLMENIPLMGLEELADGADFISAHVPINKTTRGMIGVEQIALMQKHGVVINLARAGVVDEAAVIAALDSGKLAAYISDFPNQRTKLHPKCVTFPHLGASTAEAEVNCARMVAARIKEYLEVGDHTGAVNEKGLRLLASAK